jgi:aspartate/methionine/tyrosine aminotransferase
MVDAFVMRRDRMLELIRQIPGIVCPKPDGAFYLFPDVSAYFGRSTPDGTPINDDEALCLYLLEKYHVAVVPGSAFGDPNGLRISYASSINELEEAMDRIATGLAQLH